MISDRSSILVISDSHGNMGALTAALIWACQTRLSPNGPFDAAVFLGDGADDLTRASAQAGFTVPWYNVRGNVDTNYSITDSLVLRIPGPQCPHEDLDDSSAAGRKLFLTHGNRHNVKEGGEIIAAAAKAAGAEAALFGHTHLPHCSLLDGVFLLNPGSIGRSRSSAGPTFAVLDCPDSGPFSARFFHLVKKDGNIDVEEIEV